MLNNEFITPTRLKSEKGWTDGAITKFLGAPDKLVPNPHYRTASKMKLFSIKRVKDVEKTPEFQEWFNTKRVKRKKSAKQAVETKRQKLFDYIDNIRIEIPDFETQEALYRAGVDHYNALWEWNDYKSASLVDDPEFLNRITTNYLRHQLTDYDFEIIRMFGKIGKDEGIERLHNRINQAIWTKYHYLEDY